jgi:hypothetical protein
MDCALRRARDPGEPQPVGVPLTDNGAAVATRPLLQMKSTSSRRKAATFLTGCCRWVRSAEPPRQPAPTPHSAADVHSASSPSKSPSYPDR